jgi:hypothetical protein
MPQRSGRTSSGGGGGGGGSTKPTSQETSKLASKSESKSESKSASKSKVARRGNKESLSNKNHLTNRSSESKLSSSSSSSTTGKKQQKRQTESITNSDDDENDDDEQEEEEEEKNKAENQGKIENKGDKEEEEDHDPVSEYKHNEYRSVMEYDCGVRNWDDNVQELECAPPETISNCWNCSYPLTRDGYFPSIDVDWTDTSSVLVQAAALLEKLRPLPKQTYGIPVHRNTDNTIELIGSCHTIACVKRYMIDTMHYNPSDVDTMISLMARDAGLPLDQLQTAPPVNTLKHRGGIYTYEQYDNGPLVETATPISTKLLHRMPQKIHVVRKGGQQKVRSMYEAYLKQAKPTLNKPAPPTRSSSIETPEQSNATATVV